MSDPERRQHWLRAALRMTRLLLADVDTREALQIVVTELRAVSGAAGAMIALVGSAYQEETGIFAAGDGLGLESLRGAAVPLQGLGLQAIRSGRVVVTEDIRFEDDPPPQVVHTQALLGLGMYLPLVAGGEVLGLLVVGWRRGSAHERVAAEEVPLVEMFAGQAALAIRQARARQLVIADRERIADALHEQAIGGVLALGTRLRSVLGRAGHESDDTRRRLYDVIEELDETTHQIRSAIFALDPARPSGRSAVSDRILGEIDAARDVIGFVPRLAVRGIVDHVLPARLEDELVRAVRAAVADIATHAGLSEVEVDLLATHDEVVLTVTNDGQPAEGSAGARGDSSANLSRVRVTFPIRPGSTVCKSNSSDGESS